MSKMNEPNTQADPVVGARLDQELIRVRVRLLEIDDSNDPEWKRLYDVQQALAWARDPRSARSPYNMVRGIPVETGDCSALPHPLPSEDTCAHSC